MAIRTIKRPRDGGRMMMKNPPLEKTGGLKGRGSGKEPSLSLLPVLLVKRQQRHATDSTTQCLLMGLPDQELKTGVQVNKPEKEEYLRGGVVKPKVLTSLNEDSGCRLRTLSNWIERLMLIDVELNDRQIRQNSLPWGVSHWGNRSDDSYAFAALWESARTSIQKDGSLLSKVEIVEWHDYKHLDWIQYEKG
ncbi:hypothetical protein Tco_1370475 [Tanacetum coccineum]